MTTDRMLEIGRQGACGLVARAILVRCGGTPYLRYDADGRAVHAAIRVNGQFIHLGEDNGLIEVSEDELKRACLEDFWPNRLGLQGAELREVVDTLCGDVR